MVDFPAKPLFFVCFCPPKNATQGKGRTFFLPSSGASCWGMMMYFCCSQTKLRDSPCQLVLGISGSSKEGKKMESGMPEKFKLTIPLTKHRTQQPFIHMDHPKMQSGVTSRHIYQLVSINFLIGCWIGKLTQVDVSWDCNTTVGSGKRA